MSAIKHVAVIGAGGVAGLATLHELLHTNSDGSSTVGEGVSTDPFFTKIIGFEQKPDIGGTWNVDGNYKADPKMPSQEILDSEKYDNVRFMRSPHAHEPNHLSGSSFESPIITGEDEKYCQWSGTAIYPRLYTNVPHNYMQYSTEPLQDDCPDGLAPFITHQQLRDRMNAFSDKYSFKNYIRFNTEVYNVKKVDNKWLLTLRSSDGNKVKWYEEEFDGVVLTQGSFSIPYIPYYPGLAQFNKLNPGVILHSKAYRDPSLFKDKKVVIVGGNISAIDIGQYLVPLAKEVVVSRDLSRDPYLPFMARCIKSFKNVHQIKEFLPFSSKIRLIDGTILEDVDHVILCTGYHIEVPFLELGTLDYSIPKRANFPNSNSRIKGLYQHIFKIEDPSLAFVGKLIVQTLFRTMESQAATVAGIWAGVTSLPPKEERYQWEQDRLSDVEEHLFHKYDIHTIKRVYFDKIREFQTDDRPDPFGDGILDKLELYENSLITFETLFKKFSEGKLDPFHEF